MKHTAGARLRIIFLSDVFPPGSVGGAAWSSYLLAHALARRGHLVSAIVPRRRRGGVERRMDGPLEIVEPGYWAPRLPFLQNYWRFERLWPQLARLVEQLAAEQQAGAALPLIVHGHHAQTIPAAVLAGQRLGVPSVATIRDYWPLHYFATGLLGDRVPVEHFGPTATAADLLLRLGPLRGPAGLLALPYVLRHIRRRAGLLAQASAVVANSRYVATRLAPLLPTERLQVIHTPVDLQEVDASARLAPRTEIAGPFVLFVGKLERNKGAHMLPAVVEAALARGARGWSLVLAGQGALRPALERQLAGLELPVHFLDWADHDEVLRLTARCAALVFPSGWAEPLTRVLIEAAALGAPIAAMATGGTPDIVEHGRSGLLAHSPAGLGRALARLLLEPALAQELGRQARRSAEQRFAAPGIAAQHEQLYSRLLAAQHGAS